MKLATKASLFLVVTVAVLVVALHFALQATVVAGFGAAEHAAAEADTRRVRDVITLLARDFAEKQCPDYAYWTELADYARGATEEGWDADNLTFDGFKTLGWAFVAIYGAPSPKDRVERLGMLVDPAAGAGAPLTPGIRRFIRASLLADAHRHAPPFHGFTRIDGRTYLVASLPTRTTDHKRPAAPGRFIAAKLIDDAWTERLEQYTSLSLALLPLEDALPDDTARRAQHLLAAGQDVTIDTTSRDELASFTGIAGLDGRPLLLLRAAQPRTVTTFGTQVVRSTVTALTLGGLVLLVLTLLLLATTIQRPLARLLTGVRELESGSRATVAIATRDELGQLASAFNQMAGTLVDRQHALDKALSDLWGEMDLAKRIQTALLPPAPAVADFAVATHMETADEVGGDYYDIIDSRVGSWLAVGDVSGHGVTAGLVMMLAHTAIRTAIVHETETLGASAATPSPSRVLATANRVLLEDVRRLGTDKYMTVSLLRRTAVDRFVHAGLHLDILVYRREVDCVEQIPTKGMWLGVTVHIERHLRDQEFDVRPGDIVLLYTDGVTEARRGDEQFGPRRLSDVLQGAAATGAEGVRAALIAALADWEREDDVSFVVLERLGQ